MSDDQKQKYYNIAVSFINNNKANLVSIYLEHSKTDGDGILLINLNLVETKGNVEVSYITNAILDIDIIEKINDRKIHNDSNIIYFLLITPIEEKIIEIDIRTLAN